MCASIRQHSASRRRRRPLLAFRFSLIVAGTSLVSGCAADQQSVLAWKDDVGRELDAAYERFREGYRRADASMVAALYADSAYYLQPNRDIIRGRDAIARGFERFLQPLADAGGPGPAIRFEVVDRDISGDLAYDVGYYTLGENDRGKFIVVWKRAADGGWRIHADGYSDAPIGR